MNRYSFFLWRKIPESCRTFSPILVGNRSFTEINFILKKKLSGEIKERRKYK